MGDEEQTMRITGCSLSAVLSTEAMYAPHAWLLWYWQWAHLTAETYGVCDEVTSDFKVTEMGEFVLGKATQKGEYAVCSVCVISNTLRSNLNARDVMLVSTLSSLKCSLCLHPSVCLSVFVF